MTRLMTNFFDNRVNKNIFNKHWISEIIFQIFGSLLFSGLTNIMPTNVLSFHTRLINQSKKYIQLRDGLTPILKNSTNLIISVQVLISNLRDVKNQHHGAIADDVLAWAMLRHYSFFKLTNTIFESKWQSSRLWAIWTSKTYEFSIHVLNVILFSYLKFRKTVAHVKRPTYTKQSNLCCKLVS